jgi:hypothetical protein
VVPTVVEEVVPHVQPTVARLQAPYSLLVPEKVIAPNQGRPATKRKRSSVELRTQQAKKNKRKCKFCHDEKHVITTCPEYNKWGAKPRPEEMSTISLQLTDANDSTYPAVSLTTSDYSQDKQRMSTVPAGTEWLCVHKKCYVGPKETITTEKMCLLGKGWICHRRSIQTKSCGDTRCAGLVGERKVIQAHTQ